MKPSSLLLHIIKHNKIVYIMACMVPTGNECKEYLYAKLPCDIKRWPYSLIHVTKIFVKVSLQGKSGRLVARKYMCCVGLTLNWGIIVVIKGSQNFCVALRPRICERQAPEIHNTYFGLISW